jgi:serine/threonine protein kinase
MSGIFSLLEGRTLNGRYRIERLIGRGGMGAVFRAADEQLDRPVALKVIALQPESSELEERLRARFRREARAAARLRHPNVVVIHDYGTDEATRLDFLVMELLEGEDLATRLRRAGPLPPAEAARVIRDAACGLGAGHRLGMVHRDVKPANVFLEAVRGGPRPVVLDFGIAQVAEEAGAGTMTHLTALGQGPLSPGWAAPEQLQGRAPLTPACDVFSLGLTAFEAVAGAPAFTDEDRRRMAQGFDVPPPSLRERAPSVPASLDEAVRRALASRPEYRFPDGDAFAEALRAAEGAAFAEPLPPAPPPPRAPEAAGGGGIAATPSYPRIPPPLPTRPPRPAGSRGLLNALAWIVGVILASLILLAIATQDREPPSNETYPDDSTTVTAVDTTVPIPVPTPDIHEVSQTTTQDGAAGMFSPSTVYARYGDLLRFTADGLAAHNVSFPSYRNPDVDLPVPGPYLTARGHWWDFQVNLPPGRYVFQCDPHAVVGEVGTLVVE